MPNRLILINPHAAGGRARSMASLIQSWAAHAGAAGAAIPTEMPETVAQALQVLGALPPETRVVVVGGDGTLNQLLPGLLQGHHSVGLLPDRELRVPQRPAAAQGGANEPGQALLQELCPANEALAVVHQRAQTGDAQRLHRLPIAPRLLEAARGQVVQTVPVAAVGKVPANAPSLHRILGADDRAHDETGLEAVFPGHSTVANRHGPSHRGPADHGRGSMAPRLEHRCARARAGPGAGPDAGVDLRLVRRPVVSGLK